MSSKAVYLSTIKMAIATFLSRILGLVREQVMAFSFGAGALTDAFLVAYRIPNLLRDLFAEGAFSAAFVPSFIKVNGKSREEARKFLWSLFILLGFVTLILSALIFYFAPELILKFAPKFQEDQQKFELCILLTRIMSPFLCFVSLSALFMGALNSLKIFFIPSLAPAFFNVSMILSMLLLPSYLMGQNLSPVLSLGVGVFIGGLVQALVQFPLLLKNGLAPTLPKKVISDEGVKVFKKLGPGLIGFAATQVNLLITTLLATSTMVGAVSWLSYAFRLFQLPVGILGVSIGNSNMVHFGTYWSEGNKEKAIETFKSSIMFSFVTMLPAVIILFILSDNIVHVIFERGEFSSRSTYMTAQALCWYALGLPMYGIAKILVPIFYTLDKQKIPVIVSIVSIAFNLAFCLSLVPKYGFEILAIGTSLSIFLNCAIQFIVLKSSLKFSLRDFINLRYFKIFLSFLLSFLGASYVKNNLAFYEYGFITKCIILFFFIVAIGLCFYILCYLLGEKALVDSVKNKFIGKLLKKQR